MTEHADSPGLIKMTEDWSLWRTICLRGTGFPIHLLDTLAADGAISAVDRVLAREAAGEQARADARDVCRRLLADNSGLSTISILAQNTGFQGFNLEPFQY